MSTKKTQRLLRNLFLFWISIIAAIYIDLYDLILQVIVEFFLFGDPCLSCFKFKKILLVDLSKSVYQANLRLRRARIYKNYLFNNLMNKAIYIPKWY